MIRDRGIHYAPRLGFAYDVTGKQSLVLRGGAGVFYDRFQGNEVFDMLTNPPTTVSPHPVQRHAEGHRSEERAGWLPWA